MWLLTRFSLLPKGLIFRASLRTNSCYDECHRVQSPFRGRVPPQLEREGPWIVQSSVLICFMPLKVNIYEPTKASFRVVPFEAAPL